MVSFNYKNKVIKGILKEEVNSEDITKKYDKISKIFNELDKSSFSKKWYNMSEDSNILKICIPASIPESYLFLDYDERQEIRNGLSVDPSIDVDLNGYHNFEGYVSCFVCFVLTIYLSDGIEYDYTDGARFFYYSKEKPQKNMASVNKILSELYAQKSANEVEESIKTYVKSLLKKDTDVKSVDTASSRASYTDVREFSKNEVDSAKSSNTDANAKIKDNQELYQNGRQKKVFTPENLVGDDKFRDIKTLQTKVDNTLIQFDKTAVSSSQDFIPQLFVSAILSDIIKDPYKTVEITPNIFTNLPHLKDNYKLSDIYKFIESHKNANLLRPTGKGSPISIAKNLLLTDPNEIIGSIALLEMGNIKWSQNGNGQSAKDELLAIFGSEADFKNGLIAFPLASNEPLVDSYAMITSGGKSKELGISTKGGANGLGSAASITSLFQFLFDNPYAIFGEKGYYNNNISDGLVQASSKKGGLENFIESSVVPQLSKLGQKYWKLYPEQLCYIVIFGGIRNIDQEQVIRNMAQNGILDYQFKVNPSSPRLVSKFADEVTSRGLTEIVMDLLDKQKYKFCQINTKPIFIGNTFKWNYEVQYPARFSGEVRFEKNPSGNSIRFHIMGSVK